jgi:phosphoribosyl-dephospho-CoA transferase
MNGYKRHDLVWINDEGKEYALRKVQSSVPSAREAEIRALIFASPPIPAIVRRQESGDPAENGLLCVGFSSPRVIEGLRFRVASKVPLHCVTMRQTPFEVANGEKGRLPDREILEALLDAGAECHTRVGCFGSAALELATGLSYRRKNSDLDIYLCHQGNWEELDLFFRRLLELERRFGVAIDAEIEYSGGYGVKLKELFGPGKTVLGKGIYDVALLPKTGVRGRLPPLKRV